MPFQYYDIKNYKAQKDELFLFDANIWIFYHNQVNPRHFQKPYTAFLNQLLKEQDDPSVLLPSCVLGEVLNRLLKDHYCKVFLQSPAGRAALLANPVTSDKEAYKKIYRSHLKYKQDRDHIYHSIFSYSNKLELINDGFDTVTFDDLTTAFTELDFNDWNIYELAKWYNATIVSDDSDFIVENYSIVTNNKDLLKLV